MNDGGETDSSGPPSLVDSSSGEGVPHDLEPDAESDTQPESSREELTYLWQLVVQKGKGKGKGRGKGFESGKGK